MFKKRWAGPGTGRDTEVEFHVPYRELTLKLVIIPVNHFMGHIIYTIRYRLKKNHLPKRQPVLPYYITSRGLSPVFPNFNSYQFKIQKVIR